METPYQGNSNQTKPGRLVLLRLLGHRVLELLDAGVIDALLLQDGEVLVDRGGEGGGVGVQAREAEDRLPQRACRQECRDVVWAESPVALRLDDLLQRGGGQHELEQVGVRLQVRQGRDARLFQAGKLPRERVVEVGLRDLYHSIANTPKQGTPHPTSTPCMRCHINPKRLQGTTPMHTMLCNVVADHTMAYDSGLS
jgi:hypothetical protein